MSLQARISAIKSLRKAYRETKKPIWRAVRKIVEGATRSRLAKVNVGKIDRLSSDGDIIVVPGKVLGGGTINKRVIVGALGFSKTAKNKIIKAGGEALRIEELLEKYKDSKGIKLIGG